MVIFFQLQNSLTLIFPSSMFKLTKFYVHKYLILKLKKSCWIYQKRIFSSYFWFLLNTQKHSSSLAPFPHNPISLFMLFYFLSFGKTHKTLTLYISQKTPLFYTLSHYSLPKLYHLLHWYQYQIYTTNIINIFPRQNVLYHDFYS